MRSLSAPFFTVGKLIEKKIMEHAEEINGVALEALNEAILENMLEKVALMWKRQEFEILNYKEQKNIFCGWGKRRTLSF